jgi:hypothetical protein
MNAWRSTANGLVVIATISLATLAPAAPATRTFPTPEGAVQVLVDVVKAGDLPALIALFGPDSGALVDGSDRATGERNRQTFLVAIAEGWSLVDVTPERKELVVGRERWPFPVPLVKTAEGWLFDGVAGKEEVLARRIGRNELAAVGTCRSYVRAQHAYAAEGRDGQPAGAFARKLRSTAGTHDGLYWPARPGERRSPLGDLVAAAAAEGTDLASSRTERVPFQGYYFRILEAQGASAPGGAASYLVNGQMTGGFALVAWPATYDVTGVMTFIVGKDGVVFEKDLGAATSSAVASLDRYDPDPSWRKVAP